MNVDLPAMTQIPLFVCIAISAARNARVVLGEPGRNHHVPAFSTPNYLRASVRIDGNPSLRKPIPSRRAQHHYPCALSTVKTYQSSLRCASSLRVSAGSRVQGPGSGLKMVATSRESSETGVLQITSPAAAKLAEKGMAQEDWDALLEVGDFVSLSEGELLMSQGDVYDEAENREVYLMLNGECRLDVADGSVARLLPGDFIGEASFTSGRLAPRTATVRAREDGVQVVMWTWGDLRAFLADPANARAKAALESYWMSGLAEKLADVMSALGGKSVVKPIENEAVQAGDYGYRYLEDVEDLDSVIPVNIVTLSSWTFAREYRALRRTFRFGEFKNTWISGPFGQIDKFLETFVFSVLRPSTVDLPRDPEVIKLQSRLSELKLGNKEIWDREDKRIAATQAFLKEETRKGLRQAEFILRTQTPWFVMLPYKVLCWLLDVIFEDRPIQRFWFLETVARMPYFSYLSMLFFYETLGWWSGASEVRKIHFAEEYNELMHLRVMESLGGDTRWSDRFFARHAAIVYFWVLVVTYMVSPFLAYNFSELIESHAVDTYTEFIEANEELLKSLPPTPQALAYYRGGDMYLFDEFQTSRPAFSRRPVIKSLFDVFQAIRDDELEHVKTMFACERSKGRSMSPNAAAATPRWAEDDPSSGRATEDLRSDLLNKTPLASAFQLLRKVTFGSKTATSSSRGENENRSQKVRAVGNRKGGTGAKKSAVKEGVANGTGRNEPGH